ncbi:MAG: carboxypeptidase-like regulatory domain-containing protein [Firmicutes bacterium]|nr:carboxypeptidase-like regulatory domain-containing protein [Bacillota bacterium]
MNVIGHLSSRMTIISLLLIVVLAFGGCSFGSQSEPQVINPSTISGVVYGSLPDTVVYMAKVTATGGGKTYTTSTDLEGKYSLSVSEGTYQVTVTKETFNTATAQITVGSGQNKTQNFALTTGAEGELQIPSSFISGIIAYTAPNEADMRTLKYEKTESGNLIFKIDLDRLLLKNVKAVPDGYKCYIYVWSRIDSPDDTGVKGTRIYRRAGTTGPFTLLASIPFGISYVAFNNYYDYDPALSPGTPSQYYAVSLWGDAGESAMSTPRQATPLPPLTLVTPNHGETEVGYQPVFRWASLEENLSSDGYYMLELLTKNDYGYWTTIDRAREIPPAVTESAYGDSYWGSVGGQLEGAKEYLWYASAYSFSESYAYTYSLSISYGRTFTTKQP